MHEILLAAATGFLSLVFAAFLAVRVLKKDPGSEKMVSISDAVHEGAMAFLYREYKAIAVFVVCIFFVLWFGLRTQGPKYGLATAVAYIVGAGCSILAGYFGMQISTRANSRTAEAAKRGMNEALLVAFPGGAVMGLTVVGLGLFALSLLYFVFIKFATPTSMLDKVVSATGPICGFSLGASSVALFARVGGGIYTKAADVGADLVGKVEAGIPEDDPRNPATIADNVGDNVGDVAGMGADLYESYVGSIISGLIIASAVSNFKGVLLCLWLAGIGVLASIVGVFFVRGRNAQSALRNGTLGSAVIFCIASFILVFVWYGDITPFYAVLCGVISGLVIGFTAEYYTTGSSIKTIARASTTGAATNIITGISIGMKSVVVPLLVIGVAILISFKFANFFGIALAGIGMLSIAGITISIDAYGPIADNAGGIAEMASLPSDVRKITDSLDAAGNTTAAIAKGFAIGSAALTALALFFAYTQVVERYTATSFHINIMDAKVITGLFIGGMVPFLFASSTMKAVGKIAFKVVSEVRRQFKEIPGLMEGSAKPDYAKCVDITTKGAMNEMIAPGLLAIAIPLLIGIFLGPSALGGALAGALVVGVPLAIFMANAGGAWDNAKKYIEAGNLGGKKSEPHKASVVGDTVGDPFKDTSAPSMNILLKLMAVVSLVFIPLILVLNKYIGITH